jgi:hypothetical protein
MRLFTTPGQGFLWNLLAPPFARLARVRPGPYYVAAGCVFITGSEAAEVMSH